MPKDTTVDVEIAIEPTEEIATEKEKKSNSYEKLVDIIRENFAESLVILEKDHGETLAQILAKSMKADPMKTLRLISSFIPKEINKNEKVGRKGESEHDITVSETRKLLGDITGSGDDSPLSEPVSDRSVLSDEVSTKT